MTKAALFALLVLASAAAANAGVVRAAAKTVKFTAERPPLSRYGILFKDTKAVAHAVSTAAW